MPRLLSAPALFGIDLDRASAGGDGFVDAAGKPAHLAEIGVIKRHVRLDRDGAAQMLDRLAELARLMGDDAEHVRGFGIVRLGGGGAPGEFVGVGQETVAALLLGEDERVAGRHRPGAGTAAGAVACAASAAMIAAACAARRSPSALNGVSGAVSPCATASSSAAMRAMHVRPVLALVLAEQPHGRVPGIILAVEHPAPIGHPRQQHPDRLAERAGEMRDRGVDRDHQIERGDGAGGVGEILEFGRKIFDCAPCGVSAS